MVLKKRTDMSSAMEEQEVGWPDLAFEVASTEWILKCNPRKTLFKTPLCYFDMLPKGAGFKHFNL
jgi:hypothetical protein